MNLYFVIGITSVFYSSSFALSFDFVATAAPSGSKYGDVTVHTMCDPTSACKQHTQSRTQCQRWNCCWLATEKKCCEKKHFIIKPDEPKAVEYQYEASNVWRRFDAARSFCQDKGMDLPQMNPKLYSKEGRKEIADSVNMPANGEHYWLGIKRYDGDNTMFKRVSDEQLVQLDGWYGGQPSSDASHNFVYWNRVNKDFVNIRNGQEFSSLFYCEKVIMP